MVALHLPSVQTYIGSQVASAIGQKLGTKVSVGRVAIGLFNHLTIDSVTIEDQAHKNMLQAERIAASLDIRKLISEGRFDISSAQLFGMNANLYRNNEKAKPNFQFVLDSLAAKPNEPKTPLDLHIQSLVIRRGTIRYEEKGCPRLSTLDTRHLLLSDISGHITIDKITDDSVAVRVRSLAMKERSGLDLRNLSLKMNVGKSTAAIDDLKLCLPNTTIHMPHGEVTYKQGRGKESTIIKHYNIVLDHSELTPADLAFLDNQLKDYKETLSLHANAAGNTDKVVISNVSIKDTTGRLSIVGNASVAGLKSTPKWKVDAQDLRISDKGIQFALQTLRNRGVNTPSLLANLGSIDFKGTAQGHGDFIAGKGTLHSDAGNAEFDISLNGKNIKGMVSADRVSLARILQDSSLGLVSADIIAEGAIAEGSTPLPFSRLTAKGRIHQFDYNNYSYRNITIDGTYQDKAFRGQVAMDDPNGKIDIDGVVKMDGKSNEVNLTLKARNLNPQALRITSALGNYTYTLNADTHISGSSLTDAVGFVTISDFNMHNKTNNVSMKNLSVRTGYEDGDHTVDIQSDFGGLLMKGRFDYKTLPNSMINLIASKIPTMPRLPQNRQKTNNDVAFIADIRNINWLNQIMDIPLETTLPIHIKGELNDVAQKADIEVRAPSFNYGNMQFANGSATIVTEGDTIVTLATIEKIQDDGTPILLDVNAKAANNKLITNIFCDTHGEKPLKGKLNAETDFIVDEKGHSTAHIRIHPSELLVDKSIWHVQPSDIIFNGKQLYVDYFQVNNNNQYINISGKATDNPSDSLLVDLNNIDVDYVLDLVNFHSVRFSGYASGTATLKNLLGTPEAKTKLTVTDFRFETGRMGTLYANAYYDNETEQINIDAKVDDDPYTTDDAIKTYMTGDTYVKGFVSPKREELDLHILADGARAEFIQGFCGSFMDNVKARARGTCRVFGGFKSVNLEGKLVADGPLDMSTLNTTYTLRHDTVTLIPDHIIFHNDTAYDREGHTAIVNGGLHHHNLKKLTYDIDVNARNFLAYDFHDYGENTFFGTVYGTGSCNISGRKGEVTLTIDAVPEKGSFIEYNSAHPDNINKAEYIKWNDRAKSYQVETTPEPSVSRTDVRINMHADVNPNFELRILMDEATQDKISLIGSGDFRANYFNKGAFNLYGTYLIDHGTYVMTIQNIIKKLFTFQNGSTMTFSGEPFGAALNLKGQYVIPSVSLADLQMGRSFTQNNIRVNCLMNIGGTAGAPNVTFDLDLPTLSSDAKQMVMSVINSQEDLNQQVLYLLAVGRFMSQRNNNATEETPQASQTSLAMQSILSGTISQQINNMLTSMVKIPNWNFGAHISTGDNGFNNAEYEGLLSGRLLNNRLLINGEFGYREKVETQQSSFIGDFDVQYLLRPNGNLAVKVYNQTNDRYFTRNSLNTQGVGLIIKKDFNNLRELFGGKKKKKKNKENKK